MSIKLGFETSFGIVQTALKDLFPDKSVKLGDWVEKIVPDVGDREILATNIQCLLRAKKNARIEKTRIPIHGHITFEDLTREIIAWSALPGDPGTPDKPPRDPDGPLEDEPEEQGGQEGKKSHEAEN